MFAAQNIDVTHCPFSAGAIHIGDYSLHIPKLPSGLGALASLAKVIRCIMVLHIVTCNIEMVSI